MSNNYHIQNGKKKESYPKQVNIRFSSIEEIQILEQWKSKNKKEINAKLKNCLLRSMKEELAFNGVKESEILLNKIIENTLDKNIIPRTQGMIASLTDPIYVKNEVINKKLNYIISELAKKKIIDNPMIIDKINDKIDDVPWMVEIEYQTMEKQKIKRKSK